MEDCGCNKEHKDSSKWPDNKDISGEEILFDISMKNKYRGKDNKDSFLLTTIDSSSSEEESEEESRIDEMIREELETDSEEEPEMIEKEPEVVEEEPEVVSLKNDPTKSKPLNEFIEKLEKLKKNPYE